MNIAAVRKCADIFSSFQFFHQTEKGSENAAISQQIIHITFSLIFHCWSIWCHSKNLIRVFLHSSKSRRINRKYFFYQKWMSKSNQSQIIFIDFLHTYRHILLGTRWIWLNTLPFITKSNRVHFYLVWWDSFLGSNLKLGNGHKTHISTKSRHKYSKKSSLRVSARRRKCVHHTERDQRPLPFHLLESVQSL